MKVICCCWVPDAPNCDARDKVNRWANEGKYHTNLCHHNRFTVSGTDAGDIALVVCDVSCRVVDMHSNLVNMTPGAGRDEAVHPSSAHGSRTICDGRRNKGSFSVEWLHVSLPSRRSRGRGHV